MFDDRVIGRPSVHKCNSVQRDTDADEVEDFVDEGTIRCEEKALSHWWPLGITHNDTLASVYQKVDREGHTYPQDMTTAPSSRANFMVLYPRPEPLP